jgi:hypothetical protein
MEKIKQPDNFTKSFAEANAVDEAAENLGYSKKLINARAKKVTNEVYDDHQGEEETKAGLKGTIEDAEKNVKARMEYIEKQIKGYSSGLPLIDITEKEFEYYAALRNKDIIDWTDAKFNENFRMLDLGNYNDTHKLVLRQGPGQEFRLCLFAIAKWNYEVESKKEIEDNQRFNQASEGVEIPKELRETEK